MTNSTPTITDVQTKWCSRCTSWHDIDDFYHNKASKDGRQSYCKKCFNAYLKEPKRAAHRAEFSREYNQRPEVIEVRRKRAKQYHKQDDVKKRHTACMRVMTAVKNGTLPEIASQKCLACGDQAEHYHHWIGYDEKHWLHVIPVCVMCNKEADKVRSDGGKY